MNKKVSVILYAPATTDASSDVFEPIIGIDNITGVYEATHGFLLTEQLKMLL